MTLAKGSLRRPNDLLPAAMAILAEQQIPAAQASESDSLDASREETFYLIDAKFIIIILYIHEKYAREN